MSDSLTPETIVTMDAEQYDALMAVVTTLIDETWPFYEGEHAYDHPSSVKVRAALATLRAAGIDLSTR